MFALLVFLVLCAVLGPLLHKALNRNLVLTVPATLVVAGFFFLLILTRYVP